MKNYQRISIIFFKLLILIIINLILLKKVGSRYLNNFNRFINENNNLVIKSKINNIIKNKQIDISSDLYYVIYDDNNDIVDLNLNLNSINKLLSIYLDILSNEINDNNSYNYLDRYYENINVDNSSNKYYLLPLGMISNNPFLYNIGPKIIVSYDLINIPSLKIEINVKNYGLNNAIIETYFLVHIDQSILKPVLYNISSYDYRFLLSTRIINGKLPSYLGTTLSKGSDSVSK